MEASRSSSTNITAAHDACLYWESLFQDFGVDDASWPDSKVQALSLGLYASCLVRIGQDSLAVHLLDQALAFDETSQQWRMTKAHALQRLLQYGAARVEFERVPSSEGAIGASTCSMRCGNVELARNYLSDFIQKEGRSQISNRFAKEWNELVSMHGVLQHLSNEKLEKDTLESLHHASKDNPLYRWIQGVLEPKSPPPDVSAPCGTVEEVFLSLLRVNLSPFDDANLLLLDDKVYLHNLLHEDFDGHDHTMPFWPKGTILPCPKVELLNYLKPESRDESHAQLYIVKQRSGYGSHGNKLLSSKDILNDPSIKELQSNTHGSEQCLLQKMVDPLFLLKGRKFSLRVYVVYFSSTEVYLSSHGLVKLAAQSMTSSDGSRGIIDPRIHMTNSGREETMEQWAMDSLRSYLQDNGLDSQQLDDRLEEAILRIFQRFKAASEDEEQSILKHLDSTELPSTRLGIPKILGLDFVVDEELFPWLVEVNRFPGLEPRDARDRKVKHQVVYDAWQTAGKRLGFTESHPLRQWLNMISSDVPEAESSLKRIV